jgi:sulfide:quinone oxidoreductase
VSARVLIAGGGIGALAGVLALREHAPPELALTLLAPGPDLVLAPETVLEATGGPPAARYDLGAIAADLGADLVRDVLEAVDVERRRAGTGASGLIGYDALLIAVGARPGPAIPGALRFAGARDAAALQSTLAGLGARPRVLLTTAAGVGWTLPLYELALLVAARHPDASIAVVTPEPRPAAVFGTVASHDVHRRLGKARVEVRTGALPEVFEDGRLWLADGGSLEADLVVALPQAAGPAIPGLPDDGHGFIPVDRFGAVRGAPEVWAAGDATTRPLKQGGLAAQQAAVAAHAIAAALGASVIPAPYEPVLRGVLLTGDTPRFLRHTAGSAVPSAAGERPRWSAPGKVADPRVASYLAAHEAFRAATAG